jgi:hypothetical protein
VAIDATGVPTGKDIDAEKAPCSAGKKQNPCTKREGVSRARCDFQCACCMPDGQKH